MFTSFVWTEQTFLLLLLFFYISSLLFLNVLVCVFYFLPVLVSLCFLSSY